MDKDLQRACLGKMGWATRKMGMLVARKANAQTVYHCANCGMWHIAQHRKPKSTRNHPRDRRITT